MQIILVKPRGFCAGVNRAVTALTLALERYGSPIYVYHEIVHNTTVVNDFQARGAIFVSEINEVPHNAILLFSAHGVSPHIRAQAQSRQITTIDATCPLVEKVHREVLRLTREGFHIILIGHRGHDEVEGLIGEAPQNITLIDREADVASLTVPATMPLACLTQTTVSIHDVQKISQRLRKRFPKMMGQSAGNICFATHNRQEAIRSLAHLANLVIVVGSCNSSNSRRLVEIAEHCGVTAYLVDGHQDLWADWFTGNETVLITSGASAPESVVQECVTVLQERFGATVNERVIREENINFALPDELRWNPTKIFEE